MGAMNFSGCPIRILFGKGFLGAKCAWFIHVYALLLLNMTISNTISEAASLDLSQKLFDLRI